jgi:hypothetical protein
MDLKQFVCIRGIRVRFSRLSDYNPAMFKPLRQRRVLIGVGVLAGVIVCLTGAALWVTLQNYYAAADYPGGLAVANHSVYKYAPVLHVRRDTSYRTTDVFPQVYNWYSSQFQLGPEARAESACIVMEKASAWFVFEQATSVMICDTGQDRMIFVMRAMTVRYR